MENPGLGDERPNVAMLKGVMKGALHAVTPTGEPVPLVRKEAI